MGFPLPSFYKLLIMIISIHFKQSLLAEGASNYETCQNGTISCGNIRNFGYPFYDGTTRPDYCGYRGFQIFCNNSQPLIIMASQIYNVLQVNLTRQTLTVARPDYYTSPCPQVLSNITINLTLFSYTSSDENIILYYNCSSPLSVGEETSCSRAFNTTSYFLTKSLLSNLSSTQTARCSGSLIVPVLASTLRNNGSLLNSTQKGFELNWFADDDNCTVCRAEGGQCGYDWTNNLFACYCSDGSNGCSNSFTVFVQPKSSTTTWLTAGSIVVGAVVLIAVVLIWKVTSSGKSSESARVEAFLKDHESVAPKRYTYSNTKRITNNFREKLGEGGYGSVYKGKLNDGRLVAVKLLKKSKGNGEEFINEVASISRTNHVNIVSLLGFCSEGSKRALIYEFMSNGSLEKFLNDKDETQSLSLDTLFRIAIGIARGLEYLHRGCNTRILHFDIKPHNILLDGEFQPKISDFGLAKSCLPKKSIISMSGMRGTAGYIAPEVFCRTFGGVSHKSDVYSYGMMVLDMIGCRRNNNPDAESRSDVYFPNHIYQQLVHGRELNLSNVSNDEEQELLMKMLLVSFWCIQTNPSSRPPMGRVVDMLEAKIESLEIPPMPTLSSPPRSPPHSSSTPIITSSRQGYSHECEPDRP
ncbi:LEAF RUST 10 DISEASE-RESISTANCE LOCUS RECEPTOR-LIKE PROTEIN [Drosera capensis]